MVYVCLQNVHDAFLDEFAATKCSYKSLSCSDRCRRAACDSLHRRHIFGWTWFFNEKEMERLNLFRQNGGNTGTRLGMEVNGNVDFVAELLPKASHVLNGTIDFCVGLNPLVSLIRQTNLEAGDTGRKSCLPQLCEVFVCSCILGVVVATDTALIVWPAEKLVDGYAQHLAANVPERA